MPIPAELAAVLTRHKCAALYTANTDFVFAGAPGYRFGSATCRVPGGKLQTRAVDAAGNPTFPVLHQVDEAGDPAPEAHGAVLSMHSFRHTVASRALLASESVDEVAFLLAIATAPQRGRSTCGKSPTPDGG